ncbi:MAG TPA: phosphoribosyltransferase [Nitratifractor sp.]|nr:phosphoribosyltransferase [Nitratifractor sp.]
MEKKYYGYSEFLGDVKELSAKVKEYNPDTLLAVARGGLTLGHFMAQALDTRRLFALNSIHYEKESKLETIEIFNIPDLKSAKRVVVVDDIVDSGETLSEIIKVLQKAYPHCEFKLATIFYKPTAIIQADYTLKEAKEWIDFFWEVDPL